MATSSELAASLARKGFRDATAAGAMLAHLGEVPEGLVDRIASVAEPDIALQSLAEIADSLGAAKLLKLLTERDL